MGIWSTLKSAAIEANEQVHADRLHRDLQITWKSIGELPPELMVQTTMKFIELRRKIAHDMPNWSPDGALSIAKRLFAAARGKQDLDRKEAYALALTGLWLESGLRNHPTALAVHEYIDARASEIEDVMREDGVADEGDHSMLELGAALMNEMVESNVSAIDANEFPNGTGEFGYSPDNPIPCNTITGSEAYLAKLRFRGRQVTFTRIGSFKSKVSANPVDGYQLSVDGVNVCNPIYISPYELRNSDRAPFGLRLQYRRSF